MRTSLGQQMAEVEDDGHRYCHMIVLLPSGGLDWHGN